MKKKAESTKKTDKVVVRSMAEKKADKMIIEKNKLAAAHHIEAAKHHMDAAKHYEQGNYEKAAHSTLLAYGHHAIAGEFLNDNAKHHVQTLKHTVYHF